MRRKAILLTLASALIILALSGGLLHFNNSVPVLENGGILSEAEAQHCILLSGWQEEDGAYTLSFTPASAALSYSILLPMGFQWDTLSINGSVCANAANSVVNIPDDAVKPNQRIVLRLAAAPYGMYVGASGNIQRFANLFLILPALTLCVMFITVFYALSLYIHKRSESYLIDYCIFAGCFLIWITTNLFPAANILGKYKTAFFWKAILLFGVKTCLTVTDAQVSPFFQKCFSWRYMCLWGLLLFPVFHRYYRTLSFSVLLLLTALLSVYILILAELQHRAKSRLMLLARMLVCSLYVIILVFPRIEGLHTRPNIYLYLLDRSYITEMPFILACMLFINQRFALHFADTESLSLQLNALVKERTNALEEQQAARQSMMLNIFHDLRSPLFALKNCLSMVEDLPESLPKMLPVMKERTDFVCELTEELFLTAKLEEKQIILNCKPVELGAFILEVCDSLRVNAMPRLTFACAAKAPLFIWGDTLRLRQIFQNLITNALYYTPEDGLVGVALEERDGKAVVTVRDTGKGIAPEDQQYIFTRYFHTNEQNKHASTGLGLTIAAELVQLHRGTIEVESGVGKGTLFIVSFPLLAEPGCPVQESANLI